MDISIRQGLVLELRTFHGQVSMGLLAPKPISLTFGTDLRRKGRESFDIVPSSLAFMTASFEQNITRWLG